MHPTQWIPIRLIMAFTPLVIGGCTVTSMYTTYTLLPTAEPTITTTHTATDRSASVPVRAVPVKVIKPKPVVVVKPSKPIVIPTCKSSAPFMPPPEPKPPLGKIKSVKEEDVSTITDALLQYIKELKAYNATLRKSYQIALTTNHCNGK